MTVYVGKTGKTYTRIEPFLGKGGEGAVYAITGMPDCVLKIYLDGKATETKYRKLQAMLDTKMPETAMQQITWPLDIVYENGRFVGYVMPQLSGTEELNVMYSDKYRCTLMEKLTIARNLCAALHSVHRAGQVCGDLNPKNIAVNPITANVKLVDTDSYHITDHDARIYRCEVGLPEYLPAEIQEKMKRGETLATASLPTFSKASDLFALAVHIFALMMNGCHPYACAVNDARCSGIAPQPIDNICNGFFPFYQKRAGVTTPKYAPEFHALPEDIQGLFIRAFVDGHQNPQMRPDATTWYQAIAQMQQGLTVCWTDPFHMYPRMLGYCPWCKVEQSLKEFLPMPVTQLPDSAFYPPGWSPLAVPTRSYPPRQKPPWQPLASMIIFGAIGCLAGVICAGFIYILALLFSGDGFMDGLNATWTVWTTVIQIAVVIGTTVYGVILGWQLWRI